MDYLAKHDEVSHTYDMMSYANHGIKDDMMYRPALANAELAVVELLRQQESLTSRQIREELYTKATTAQHGSVQRLLSLVEDKDYVERDDSQPVLRFSAPVTRQEYASGQLEAQADQ